MTLCMQVLRVLPLPRTHQARLARDDVDAAYKLWAVAEALVSCSVVTKALLAIAYPVTSTVCDVWTSVRAALRNPNCAYAKPTQEHARQAIYYAHVVNPKDVHGVCAPCATLMLRTPCATLMMRMAMGRRGARRAGVLIDWHITCECPGILPACIVI